MDWRSEKIDLYLKIKKREQMEKEIRAGLNMLLIVAGFIAMAYIMM